MVLSPCQPPAFRPASGHGPWVPTQHLLFAMKRGSQVSSSSCCVGSVQTDRVRSLQRLFSWGGVVSDVGLLQNHRELVKMPTDVPDEQLILSVASFCFF